MRRHAATLLLALALPGAASAAVCSSTGNGVWTANIWGAACPAGGPTAADDVTITHPTHPRLHDLPALVVRRRRWLGEQCGHAPLPERSGPGAWGAGAGPVDGGRAHDAS